MLKSNAMSLAKEAVKNFENQAADLNGLIRRLDQDHNSLKNEATSHRAHLAVSILKTAGKNLQLAAEKTGATCLSNIQEEFENHRSAYIQRIEILEGLDTYRDRDRLLDPEKGQLTLKIRDARQVLAEAEKSLSPYQFKEFQWMFQRGCHLPAVQSGFKKFLRVMTLADFREKRAFEKVQTLLGEIPFAEMAATYELFIEQFGSCEANLNRLLDYRTQILDEIEEVQVKKAWLANYASELFSSGLAALTVYLESCDLIALHNRLPAELRQAAACCHADLKKMEYLSHLRRALEADVQDRMKRVAAVTRVLNKWRRGKSSRVSDKTHWLETVPEIKRKGTLKRLDWCNTIRVNLVQFQQYGHYSNLMLTLGTDFLAWDAFGVDSPQAMPYEGFTRTVIPELDQYRRFHQMDRPDYSLLRRAHNKPFHFNGWHVAYGLVGYAALSYAMDDEPWFDDSGYDGEEYEDAAAAALAMDSMSDFYAEDLS